MEKTDRKTFQDTVKTRKQADDSIPDATSCMTVPKLYQFDVKTRMKIRENVITTLQAAKWNHKNIMIIKIIIIIDKINPEG